MSGGFAKPKYAAVLLAKLAKDATGVAIALSSGNIPRAVATFEIRDRAVENLWPCAALSSRDSNLMGAPSVRSQRSLRVGIVEAAARVGTRISAFSIQDWIDRVIEFVTEAELSGERTKIKSVPKPN